MFPSLQIALRERGSNAHFRSPEASDLGSQKFQKKGYFLLHTLKLRVHSIL
jgi:hypothetical protein